MLTDGEMHCMPWTRGGLTIEEFEYWYASRKEVARSVDIEIAEIARWAAYDADPYGILEAKGELRESMQQREELLGAYAQHPRMGRARRRDGRTPCRVEAGIRSRLELTSNRDKLTNSLRLRVPPVQKAAEQARDRKLQARPLVRKRVQA